MSSPLNINVENVEFLTLIATFTTSGMVSLGKIPNPVTNQMERDLFQAQIPIDMLIMLKEKTKGNLDPEEERALTNAIADLQINYMHEKQLDEQVKS